MTLDLPIELQQHVFDFLDPQSFYASRRVCRSWRHASTPSPSSTVTLKQQLHRLPIEPSPLSSRLAPERLLSLYNEAAHSLMLGMHVGIAKSEELAPTHTMDKSKVVLSPDNRHAAALDADARQITHHDLTLPDCPVISARPLNDLRRAVGGGPWFSPMSRKDFSLALSSDGNLLAVGQDRMVHVYDLASECNSWPVSSDIHSATGNSIAGLSFEHNDSLLRVQLSNKGAVIYLGTPKETTPDMGHWKSKEGLRHTFFDSSTTTVRSSGTWSPVGGRKKFQGVKLLRPFENGWLFAAQQHGGSASSSYCIGHVPVSTVDGHVETAERFAVVLADLPSFLSAYPYTLRAEGLWSGLPSAQEQYPGYALSDDNTLLALTEPKFGSEPTNKVFVYRLPCQQQAALALKEQSQGPQDEEVDYEDMEEMQEQTYKIHRLPLCLGEITGEIRNLSFETCADGDRAASAFTCKLQVKTSQQNAVWILTDS
ncbi:hypothetical protein H2203_002967 [Taxawa tesnikishii (nom. ined.)]|nr:hypothetical protein H2203_002967 [Dothideales sp. JES 119]